MGMLQPSHPGRRSRLKKSRNARKADTNIEQQSTMARVARPDIFDSIDEAVLGYRRGATDTPGFAGSDPSAQKLRASPRITNSAATRDAPAMSRAQQRNARRGGSSRSGGTIEYRTGSNTYAFPTPSTRVPTRSATFQDQDTAPLSATLPRGAAHQERQRFSPKVGSPAIGMAIGSPSQIPPTGSTVRASEADLPRPTPPLISPYHPRQQHTNDSSRSEVRTKNSSWKSFGNMFRKAPKRSDEALYNSQPGMDVWSTAQYGELPAYHVEILQNARPKASASCLPSPNSSSPQHWGHPRSSQDQPRHSPPEDIRPKQAAQRPVSKSKPNKLRKEPPQPSPRRSPLPRHITVDEYHRTQTQSQTQAPKNSPRICDDNAPEESKIPVPPTPHLDLDLPELSFPRYSVMFEKLLTSDGRPSLLERRQSKQQRKSVRMSNVEGLEVGALSGGMKRSQTPQHLISPSPAEMDAQQYQRDNVTTNEPKSEQSHALAVPPPFYRSNSDPGKVLSPIATSFMRERGNTQNSSSPESLFGSTTQSESSLPPTPTTTTVTEPSSIRRMLEDADPNIKKGPLLSLSKPLISRKSNSYNSQNCFSTSDGTSTEEYLQQITCQQPRVRSPEELEAKMQQVSLARRVSVSRSRNINRISKSYETPSKKSTVVPLRPRIIEFSKNRKSAAASLVMDDAAADAATVEGRRSLAEERYGPMPVGAAEHSRKASKAFEEAMREKERKGSLASVKSERQRRKRSCSVKSEGEKSLQGSVVLAVEAEEVVDEGEEEEEEEEEDDDDDDRIPDVPAVPEEIRKASIVSTTSQRTQESSSSSSAGQASVKEIPTIVLQPAKYSPPAPRTPAKAQHEQDEKHVEDGQLVSDPAKRETIHVRLEGLLAAGPAEDMAASASGNTETFQDVKAQIDDAIESVQALLEEEVGEMRM